MRCDRKWVRKQLPEHMLGERKSVPGNWYKNGWCFTSNCNGNICLDIRPEMALNSHSTIEVEVKFFCSECGHDEWPSLPTNADELCELVDKIIKEQ